MIAIGMTLIFITLYAVVQWRRGKLFADRRLLWVFVFAAILPQIANQIGWYTAEMGRQPWVVYNQLRTSDALSKTVTENQVLFSLTLFFSIYALLFLLFVYMLNKKIKHGPKYDDAGDQRPLQKEMSEALTRKNQ
jgi:cytochrome d ubiquinol oxidase subunit I